MPKTKSQKKQLVEQYKEMLKENPNYILISMDKVNTPQINELKKQLRDSNSQMFVIKNTIFKIAAEEMKQPTKVQELEGNNGIIVFGEDPTQPAKALKDLQKKYEIMTAKFGVLFGDAVEESKIKELASIPPKEVLLAKILGGLQSPISGIMAVLNGNVRKFVYALSEIQKTKQS